MPLALYHFHRSGLYGVGANIVAIPLTTFVIMPLEATALPLEPLGIRSAFLVAVRAIDRCAPRPRPCGQLDARGRRASPVDAGLGIRPDGRRGNLAVPVDVPLAVARSHTVAVGAIGAALAPAPDLLITGDGRHLAVVDRRRPVHPARPRRRLCAKPAGRGIRLRQRSRHPRQPAGQRLLARRLRRADSTRAGPMAPARNSVVLPDRLGSLHRRLRVGGHRRRRSPASARLPPALAQARCRGLGAHRRACNLSWRTAADRQRRRACRQPSVGARPPLSSGGSGRRAGPGSAPAADRSAAARNCGWPGRAGSCCPRGGRS